MTLNIIALEESFAKIKPFAEEFSASFYRKLFREYPQVQPLFANSNMGDQKQKLVAALVLMIENLNNPEVLEKALKGLGARHEKYGVLPEHYPLIGKTLLQTFEFYLGEEWTPEVKQAWVDAYQAISELMLSGVENRDFFSQVNTKIVPLKQQLLNHRVYEMLTNVSALRIFMEHHCYAVWDFMCLLKCLQHKLTCLTVPWKVPQNMRAAHMINEIVIAEETDVRPNREGYASHFELYLEAMTEIGADTDTVRRYTDLVAEGMHWQKAMQRANVPEAVVPFITETLNICEGHPAYEVAAFFLFGRENLIPDMFRQIVEGLATANGIKIDGFRYYLERHISIDEEEHGPASIEMMNSMCGEDQSRWRIVQRAAQEALTARLSLWDGIADAIHSSGVN